MNVAGHNADFAFAGRDDARTVGTDQASFAAHQRTFDLQHIQHGNAFGDAHDQFNFSINSF